MASPPDPLAPSPLVVRAPPADRPEIGTFNHLEASIGQRGMGKSTHQCARALELSREAGGAYVIGHSLGGRLPSKLPADLGGDTLPIVYYETIDKLESGLRRHPDKWHILAPPIEDNGANTADDLIRFVIRLSRSLRKAAWEKAHPFGVPGARFGWRDNVNHEGVRCVPIVLLVDEGIAVEAAGHSRKDGNKWFLAFLYSLRHYHVALLYAIQDPSARSWRILEQATAIYVFAVRHAWALLAIQAAGASPEEIDRIKRLKRFEHVRLSWETPTTVDVPEFMRESKGK